MKNKKSSHVGFILSFVLFVTTIIFLYALLEPSLRTDTGKTTLSNNLQRELTEKLSSELDSVTLSVLISPEENCLLFVGLLNNANLTNNIIAQDKSGNVLASYVSGDNLYIDASGTDLEFFRVFASEEFPETETYSGTPSSCDSLSEETGYTIGLSRTEDFVFESKVPEILNEYLTSYENLKNELKVTQNEEFGFGFVYENGTLTGTENPELIANIYVERNSLIYIDTKANLRNGYVETKIW